jgi:hypothetical protein
MVTTFFANNQGLCKDCDVPFILSGGKISKKLKMKVLAHTFQQVSPIG